jgi:hypothetical protein
VFGVAKYSELQTDWLKGIDVKILPIYPFVLGVFLINFGGSGGL